MLLCITLGIKWLAQKSAVEVRYSCKYRNAILKYKSHLVETTFFLVETQLSIFFLILIPKSNLTQVQLFYFSLYWSIYTRGILQKCFSFSLSGTTSMQIDWLFPWQCLLFIIHCVASIQTYNSKTSYKASCQYTLVFHPSVDSW
jgi:hypothetical protein